MKWLTALLLMTSVQGWTMVTAPNADCPIQFEGRVQEIIEPEGSVDRFSLQKVIFTPERILKGEVGDRVILDSLVNGPFQFERGEDYLVKMRDGRVCWMEKL